MARAYLPLPSVAYPPQLSFSNGVRTVSRNDFHPPKLLGWGQVFAREELREIEEWHMALARDWTAADLAQDLLPEASLADVRLALQVAAPTGTFLSVCIREQDNSHDPLLMVTRLERFHGTVWSRMRGFTGMADEVVEAVVNGILHILGEKNPRTSNPIRLYEQGLITANPYIRIFLWVSAIDGILMAVKEKLFVQRLCAFLGPESRVFPEDDGVYIDRPLPVRDVALDLFVLRSEIAHGKEIRKRFWQTNEDLKVLCPINAYGDSPGYVTLLEEAALSLLSRILRKIILENLSVDFANVKLWKMRLNKKPHP